jgi:hypothetical protein
LGMSFWSNRRGIEPRTVAEARTYAMCAARDATYLP